MVDQNVLCVPKIRKLSIVGFVFAPRTNLGIKVAIKNTSIKGITLSITLTIGEYALSIDGLSWMATGEI